MPPQTLVDLTGIDLAQIQIPIEEVRIYNAHRFEMEQLDGVIWLDRETKSAVGVKTVRNDEFWVRGHIPGRPLLPGVVMIESAGQLCSFVYKACMAPDPKIFLGFAGVNNVKFRRPVVPGERLITIARLKEARRRVVFDTQGLVDGGIVYEGEIIGMPV
ncbi:MAG: beta-hydroxyacyl-ACP dehydratase [Candidatus Brocadiae bacterium]|nr:beta-hydroxyacyl-ACP dehydratase [Candidatus Brocadiia bacterium]